jgi:hypothetical protein
MKKSGNIDGNVVKPQINFEMISLKLKQFSYRERITIFVWGEKGKKCRWR